MGSLSPSPERNVIPRKPDGSRADAGRCPVCECALEPAGRRYTLDELLAQCDPKASRTKEEHEWLSDKAVGDELI